MRFVTFYKEHFVKGLYYILLLRIKKGEAEMKQKVTLQNLNINNGLIADKACRRDKTRHLIYKKTWRSWTATPRHKMQ